MKKPLNRHEYLPLGDTDTNDEKGEKEEVKYKYPWQIFFIIINEACERFSFYGMNAILTLFMIELFKRTMTREDAEDLATELFHLFKFLCYFSPLFGAALADSWFGKYRTIFYLSLVYAAGQIILSFGSTTGLDWMQSANLPVSFVGIFLISIGTGGIKPCVVSLGADQFKVPEQRAHMAKYFGMFYAAINFGSLISTIVTPYLREVECLDAESCYPLAFGVPAGLMLMSIVVFFMGRNKYKINIPERNVLVDSSKCVWVALKNRKLKKKGEHWLEAANSEFGEEFTSELKAVFRVGTLFIMYPMYWALYEQQGSRWTIQASNMNGQTGGIIILPEQVQVANPLLILLLIPFFDYVVYPVLGKFKLLTRPLQRIVAGCVIVALAFVVSGILELQMREYYAKLPEEGQGHLTIHNGLPTPVTFEEFPLEKKNFAVGETSSENIATGSYSLTWTYQTKMYRENLTLSEEELRSYVLLESGGTPSLIRANISDQLEKSSDPLPHLRFIVDLQGQSGTCNLLLEGEDINESVSLVAGPSGTLAETDQIVLEHIEKIIISIKCQNNVVLESTEFEPGFGARYNMFVVNKKLNVHELTPPNGIHIFWILPQYLVLTTGEILFSITSLEFAYSQAPTSMKAVMQALFYLTNAFGNLIALLVVLIVSKLEIEQYIEFFLFSGLLGVFTAALAFLAYRYKYVDYTEGEMFEENLDESKEQ